AGFPLAASRGCPARTDRDRRTPSRGGAGLRDQTQHAVRRGRRATVAHVLFVARTQRARVRRRRPAGARRLGRRVGGESRWRDRGGLYHHRPGGDLVARRRRDRREHGGRLPDQRGWLAGLLYDRRDRPAGDDPGDDGVVPASRVGALSCDARTLARGHGGGVRLYGLCLAARRVHDVHPRHPDHGLLWTGTRLALDLYPRRMAYPEGTRPPRERRLTRSPHFRAAFAVGMHELSATPIQIWDDR